MWESLASRWLRTRPSQSSRNVGSLSPLREYPNVAFYLRALQILSKNGASALKPGVESSFFCTRTIFGETTTCIGREVSSLFGRRGTRLTDSWPSSKTYMEIYGTFYSLKG